MVCQLSFQGGLQPQIFEGEIYCYGRVDEDALAGMQYDSSQSLLPEPAWATASGSGNGRLQAAEDEEIIAEHPAK